jgi:hypothetical protein
VLESVILPPFATPGPAAEPTPSVTPAPVAGGTQPGSGPASTPRRQTPQIGGPAPTTPPAPPSPSQPSQPQPPASTTPAATPPTPTQAPSAAPAAALMLTTDRGASAIVSLADLVPGDLMDRTISVKNTGTLAFRYVVSASQSASTLLWTNTAQGLQLTVTSGSSVLYAGPLSTLGSLAGPATIAPGATDAMRYTFAFPVTASDALQGLTQDLTLVFTATQYP